MKRSFTVTIDVPKGATVEDCIEYIDEAVKVWKGQLRPPQGYSDDDSGDPMWYLDDTKITVKPSRVA